MAGIDMGIEVLAGKTRINQRAFVLAIRSSDHLERTRRFDAAAQILENYLHAYPAEPAVLRRLGRIRLQQGRAEEAAQLLRQALEFQG